MSSINLDTDLSTIVLTPCKIITKDLSFYIPILPEKVDIVFCVDLTGSMYDFLSNFKSQTANIINNLSQLDTDIQFGLTSTVDYPHYYTSYGYSNQYGEYPDYPYMLNHKITNNTSDILKSIADLELGYGADAPECYSRAFYESYADLGLGWRIGAKKILVHFADNVPHDNNLNVGVPEKTGIWSTGGDPGRDEIMFTPDDLDLQTVLMDMKNNNIILVECRTESSSYFEYWTYWTSLVGGSTIRFTNATLTNDVTNVLINTIKTPIINKLHLVTTPGFEDWLVSIEPEYYAGVTDTTVQYTVKIKAPKCTKFGNYDFTIYAVDDAGVIFAHYNIVIKVIPPKNYK